MTFNQIQHGVDYIPESLLKPLKEHRKADSRINLHNLAKGDSVYCDDGSEHVVDSITFEQSYAVITFYDFGTFEFNYDGTKRQEDSEVGNIINILHTEVPHAHDPVNHPTHYTDRVPSIECISVVENFDFCLGSAIKYIWRAGLKDPAKEIEDLKKARWLLDREIQRLEGLK